MNKNSGKQNARFLNKLKKIGYPNKMPIGAAGKIKFPEPTHKKISSTRRVPKWQKA